MIKQGIKNFFVSLKYFFTPLGTLALGLILGLSIALPMLSGSLHTLSAAIEDAHIDQEGLKASLLSAFSALDWRNPLEAVKTIISADGLKQIFQTCVSAVTDNMEGVSEAINGCVKNALTAMRIVIGALILGAVVGYFLTRFLIRRKIAKRSVLRFIFGTLLSAVVTSFLLALCAYLAVRWRPSVYFSLILSILFYGIITLTNAYLMHGHRCVKLKEVVNIKNILKLLVTNLLIFVFCAAFMIILIFAINAIVGIVLGLVFFEIGFLVIDMNAEAYVKNLCDQKSE